MPSVKFFICALISALPASIVLAAEIRGGVIAETSITDTTVSIDRESPEVDIGGIIVTGDAMNTTEFRGKPVFSVIAGTVQIESEDVSATAGEALIYHDQSRIRFVADEVIVYNLMVPASSAAEPISNVTFFGDNPVDPSVLRMIDQAGKQPGEAKTEATTSFSCAGNKVAINGVATIFTSVRVCAGGTELQYDCSTGSLQSNMTPNSPYCESNA